MQSRLMSSREARFFVSVREALVQAEVAMGNLLGVYGPNTVGEMSSVFTEFCVALREISDDFEGSTPVQPASTDLWTKAENPVVESRLGPGNGDGERDGRVRLDTPRGSAGVRGRWVYLPEDDNPVEHPPSLDGP